MDCSLVARSAGHEVVTLSARTLNPALQDAPLRREMNVLLVAVRQGGEKLVFNPSRDIVLATGDKLLALGQPEMLRQLETLADGS